ncbi:hypothetical protein ABK040_012355 [Willaertia magna]
MKRMISLGKISSSKTSFTSFLSAKKNYITTTNNNSIFPFALYVKVNNYHSSLINQFNKNNEDSSANENNNTIISPKRYPNDNNNRQRRYDYRRNNNSESTTTSDESGSNPHRHHRYRSNHFNRNKDNNNESTFKKNFDNMFNNNSRNIITKNSVDVWNFPKIELPFDSEFNFKKVAEGKDDENIPFEDEDKIKKLEKLFKEITSKYILNNISFKNEAKCLQYDLIFELFCNEIIFLKNRNLTLNKLFYETLKFHPNNILELNNLPLIDENETDINKTTTKTATLSEICITDSGFSEYFSKWFNLYIQQRYLNEFILYNEALKTCDMTNPFKYLKRNLFGRKIIYHLGPTNSGKTHHALKRLSSAENGLYCGPLRLLAQEVFTKMNTQYGCRCNLLTGQEVRRVPGSQHISCTIEMANVKEIYDVAVIDEIQMIADNQRGNAWTRALLGLQAKELHLCGDGSALGIVKNLLFNDGRFDNEIISEVVEATTEDQEEGAQKQIVRFTKKGVLDTLEVVYYERMQPLKPLSQSLNGKVDNIEDNDCIVAFSRNQIFEIKKLIEMNTKKKCCVIYGALPPEVRAEQADLYNDPEQTDFKVLVASDAVGMGLNLNIKRVVFYKMAKYDSTVNGIAALSPTLVKQIAGRAGRRGFHEFGEVTTFFNDELDYLHQCLSSPVEEITQAGLFPDYSQIESFAKVIYPNQVATAEGKGLSIYNILQKFFALSKVHKDFFFCDYQHVMTVAKAVDQVEFTENLTLREKYEFVTAPVPGYDRAVETHIKYVESFASPHVKTVPLHMDIDNILRILDKVREGTSMLGQQVSNTNNNNSSGNGRQPRSLVSVYIQEALKNIEFYHKMIDLYLWLGNRYPLRFDRDIAEETRELLMTEMVESLITQTEENKRLKAILALRNAHTRNYLGDKEANVEDNKKVLIGNEYFKKVNKNQVEKENGEVKDLLDVIIDGMK